MNYFCSTYYRRLTAFFVLTFSLLEASSATEDFRIKQETPKFIAFGDMRGHFEPCGCNLETDMGGIERIAGFIELERSRFKELEVYSLGSNFHLGKFNVEDQYISKALDALKLTAKLLGPSERQNLKYIDNVSEYLLTNSLENVATKKIIETPQNMIFGISEDVPFDITHESFIKNKLKHSTKRSLLLYSGSQSLLKNLLENISFDGVIAANFKSYDVYPDESERLDESSLSVSIEVERLLDGKKAKIKIDVPVTPIGGQGVLLYGINDVSLQHLSSGSQAETTDCSDSAQGSSQLFRECAPAANDKDTIFSDIASNRLRYKWLDRGALYKKTFEPLFAQYRRASTGAFEEKMKERAAFIATSPFAGSAACAGCHMPAFKAFKASRHATAFETLKAQKQEKNEACVGCHVVGLDKQGGFVSPELTPNLMGVGCEQCHGPRKEHISLMAASNPLLSSPNDETHDAKKTVIVKEESKKNCLSCHHSPHTSEFKFDNYWPKIAH